MSTYEDYGRAAVDYDASRVPVGVEVVLGALQAHGVAPSTAEVLDAGCGTGSYAATLAPHVGHLTLVDASEAMLRQARAKLDGHPVDLRRARLDALGAIGPFDAVIVNQVLHHLGDEEGGPWAAHGAVVAELARVLRPGGVIVVNTCSQAQLRRGYWYYRLVPEAADALRRRYAPLEELEAAMTAAGLTPVGRFVPTDAVVQGASYLDGRSPLDPVWRNGDSAWSLASADELAGALERVTEMDATGTLGVFVAEHDRERPDLGQISFVVARRP